MEDSRKTQRLSDIIYEEKDKTEEITRETKKKQDLKYVTIDADDIDISDSGDSINEAMEMLAVENTREE